MFPPEDVRNKRQPIDIGQYFVWLVVLAAAFGIYYVWSHPAPRSAPPDATQAQRLAPIGLVTVTAPTPPAAPT
ncbi:MAG: hypothetical protein JZU52_04530, partial [Lamprocystis purpurea]|nr:hypothetical protein [Lamprocystis purpurea]